LSPFDLELRHQPLLERPHGTVTVTGSPKLLKLTALLHVIKNCNANERYLGVNMKNNKQPLFLAPFLPSHAMPPLDLKTQPDAPDYATAESWLVKPADPTAPVDVFFVYPTVLSNDTEWIMDTTRLDMRSAAMKTIKFQASVFEGQANIYAPMYRQMNLAGLELSDTDAAPLQEIAHKDVWRALSYYLKYENNGRPFFWQPIVRAP
jgi:hypothetical protein